MKKEVLEYGDDWKVEVTANIYRVCRLPYDEDTFIGIKKTCVLEIMQVPSSVEFEPELVAILFAAIKFNRKTVSPSNRCHKLTFETITEGLKALVKNWDNFEYDQVLDIFINASTQDVEEIITSDNPSELIKEIIIDN